MDLNLETLLVVLTFVLPGFLTSRLVDARTPSYIKQSSAFVETSESLLRSIIIQLCITILVILVILLLPLFGYRNIFSITYSDLQQFIIVQPLKVVICFFVWLLISILVAGFFGIWWDPLDIIQRRLGTKIGVENQDPWYILKQVALDRRKTDKKKTQLWVQARMKNNYTYQGEFFYADFNKEETGGCILLWNAKLYPYPVYAQPPNGLQESCYDAVLLRFENCESIELMYSNPPENESRIGLNK